MANLLETTGPLVFLRAHDLGTGYGPPTDFLDVEAVFIQNAISNGARGFQLRNDQFLPARQAMFSLLRDAFVHNLPVTADFEIDTGKQNGTAIRIALVRTQTPNPIPVLATGKAGRAQVSPPSGAVGKAGARAAKASKKSKSRKG